jgi:3,4-dihydroxy-2-butanone 4-phosphate synthase
MTDHDESVISEFNQNLTSKAAANDVLLWANDHNVDVTKVEELIYYLYEFRDAGGGVDASPLVCVR